MSHPLHEVIGRLLDQLALPNCEIVKDPAAGGLPSHIPLFLTSEKSLASKVCNVDAVILTNHKVRVIIEIEEANVKPTQICGKFLTSALAHCLIHENYNNQPVLMNDSVAFIQILNTGKLKQERTSKIRQWKLIESAIQQILPVSGSRIDQYKIFWGDHSDYTSSDSHLAVYLAQSLG